MHGDDSWIQTYTGRKFWPLDPRSWDVCLEDVAHALAVKCRYGGHCRGFYSVAQHSVLVSQLLAEWKADIWTVRWGLLHDANEAYSADVVRPIKNTMRDVWKAIEE